MSQIFNNCYSSLFRLLESVLLALKWHKMQKQTGRIAEKVVKLRGWKLEKPSSEQKDHLLS